VGPAVRVANVDRRFMVPLGPARRLVSSDHDHPDIIPRSQDRASQAVSAVVLVEAPGVQEQQGVRAMHQDFQQPPKSFVATTRGVQGALAADERDPTAPVDTTCVNSLKDPSFTIS
jgi:hypothetical protein